MKANEIREKYLRFFEKKGHTIVKSDSLVPENDPTLLFTGAGMNQFKDMFLGRFNRPYRRATSSQKCLRTGDLENVGKTPSHHTFFEMLGNFSFGDYFKAEAIPWAWEFLLEELKFDPAKLNVTVYEKDDEAFGIWEKIVGAKKIFRGDAKDNFWPANAPADGPNGPCGPCSEIYFDRGEKYGCGQPDCNPLCSRCKRHIEIWNLVFTQFDRRDGGLLEPLPQKNIDTGSGFERVVATIQGVPTNFDSDLFVPIIRRIEEITGREYRQEGEDTSRFRRIADHVRAVCFLISDGVVPGNEGREYVERKILRRAADDGRAMGMKETWLYRLVPVIAEVMGQPYPELLERRENIARIVKAEEERYAESSERALEVLEREFERLRGEKKRAFPGKVAFSLYDTHGFPFDRLEGLLKEKGFTVDKAEFDREMEAQRTRSRKDAPKEVFATGPLSKLKGKTPVTQFLGYEKLEAEGRVEAIIRGSELVDEAAAGTDVTVILDATPFYGESGGQVGDAGAIRAPGVEVRIDDTQRVEGYFLHTGKVVTGTLKAGATVRPSVDVERRIAVQRNHTATHVLHNALRTILGKHVEQAGSLVAPDRLRFDFSHFQAVSRDEIRRIESYVNERIMENAAVTAVEIPIARAREEGAMMFFADKYGDIVRMVSVGDWSKELCGGTHVPRAGSIGYFHIVSEGSVAGGTRRIEAVSGQGAVQAVMALEDRVQSAAAMLNAPPVKLGNRIQEVLDELQAVKREAEKARRAGAAAEAGGLQEKAIVIGGEKVVVELLQGRSSDDLRSMIDKLVKEQKIGVAVLGSVHEEKPVVIIGVRQDLTAKIGADALAKDVGKAMGAGGGGKKDLAQCGGKDPSRVPAALQAARELLKAKLA